MGGGTGDRLYNEIADWSNHQVKRFAISNSTLQDITGEIGIDLGRVNLEVSDLEGAVDIRNRFGTTRFHLKSHEVGSRYRVESDSGEVLVFLHEDLIGEMTLTVHTLCGVVKHDALKDLGALHTSNSRPMSRLIDADLYIRTLNGDVTLEKTM